MSSSGGKPWQAESPERHASEIRLPGKDKRRPLPWVPEHQRIYVEVAHDDWRRDTYAEWLRREARWGWVGATGVGRSEQFQAYMRDGRARRIGQH